jgi:hypothetical protein
VTAGTPPPQGLDPLGWAIANLHSLLGHDKAAAILGVPAYDKDACLICAYERHPTPEAKQAVYDALAPAPSPAAARQ